MGVLERVSARLLDHLTVVMGGYVLAYVLASVQPLSDCTVGPPWPVIAMTVLFFLGAGYHSGRRLFRNPGLGAPAVAGLSRGPG